MKKNKRLLVTAGIIVILMMSFAVLAGLNTGWSPVTVVCVLVGIAIVGFVLTLDFWKGKN